jgi:hypothetical protein
MKPLWEHSPFPLWVGVITIKWTNDDKGFKDYSSFLVILLSHIKDFVDETFCNILFKIHIISSIHHIFCINFWWISKNFLKMDRFYQILCLILKKNPNFTLHENMVVILWFLFLYHKIQLCFRCHVHHTPFTCGKGFLKS